MTKLMEWLAGIAIVIGLWMAILVERMNSANSNTIWDVKPNAYIVLVWPLGLIAAFGIYSVLVIGKRVYDFNDCQEAAEELKKQILEAKTDLKSKGFDCDNTS